MGVFMPIANNGWIISKNAPQYMPTWELNRSIAQYAESIGFDYVFSMIKWRGFGGATRHWDYSLESMTLMSALAAVTERIGIIASVQPLVFNPVVAAKMAATVDEISGGRFGINLVTGQYFDEYAQMGVLPDGYASARYDYAQEWTEAVKRLWTEDNVDFTGKYYEITNCTSNPKPVRQPHPPIVCAGMSERGMEFTARNGERCFITGTDFDSLKVTSKRAKEVAATFDTTIKTDTVLVLILADTDAEAQTQLESYREGVDVEAWKNIFGIYAKDVEGASSRTVIERAKRDVFFAFLPVAGSAETVAGILGDLVVGGDLDGILLTFPDYLDGLRRFNDDVKPLMTEAGVAFTTTPAAV
jgi:pyrimidine oxygenase